MQVKLDRDMIISELYELRAIVANMDVTSDESRQAKSKIDSLIQLLSMAPASDSNASFPKISVRRR
jgi:hypothetical protein